MSTLPRRTWKPSLATPNELHLVWFDPGAGATGWTHFVVNAKAFSRPEHKILANLISWNCGEFTGTENEQLRQAERLILSRHLGQFRNRWDVGTEDFQLTQTKGGKNLLSPERINAVLDWICFNQGITLKYQNRAMRTQTTKEKLKLYGFGTGFRKDEFAAMQHTVLHLKRIKAESKGHPWKLSDGIVANAYYDCSCATEAIYRRIGQTVKHDLIHP
jgi:hypothetical protein